MTHALRADGFDASEDGTGRGTPLTLAIRGRAGESTLECRDDGLANAILTPNGGRGGIGVGAIAIQNATRGQDQNGLGIALDGPMYTLDDGSQHAVAFNARQDPDAWAERTGPLDTDGTTQAVAFSCKDHGADAGEVAPTLRAMGHTGSHANAGGQVAVQQSMSVRRLTPRECERLQGFPTVIDRITVTACLDPQNDRVTVALQCRKLPDSAPDADGDASSASASRADIRLQNDQESRESLVAVHVRTAFEPKVAAIRSHGRWFLSAGNAAMERWSLPLAPEGSFARALAALPLGLAREATDGRAGSHQSTPSFTLPAHGRWRAAMFGDESMAVASAVESARTEATTFIMSNRGRGMLPCGSINQTSLCFVLDAIALCIPERTRRANSFKAVIDVESDYTAIEYRGKLAADGPRYKALGNSMAVPVMSFIGKRIMAVEEISCG